MGGNNDGMRGEKEEWIQEEGRGRGGGNVSL